MHVVRVANLPTAGQYPDRRNGHIELYFFLQGDARGAHIRWFHLIPISSFPLLSYINVTIRKSIAGRNMTDFIKCFLPVSRNLTDDKPCVKKKSIRYRNEMI